jgi:hypothetical protein
MKKSLLFLVFGPLSLCAQPMGMPTPARLEANLRYLASDELKGRRTGSDGNLKAAEFIAAEFKALNCIAPLGADQYFQPVPLRQSSPSTTALMKLDDVDYMFNQDFIILNGKKADLKGEVIFAGHGWINEESGHNDYSGLDVSGKIVLVLPGPPDASDPATIFRAMMWKQKFAFERGAIALFELHRIQFPWTFFRNYFGKPSIALFDEDEGTGADTDALTYGWIKEKEMIQPEKLNGIKAEISHSGTTKEVLKSYNVVGIIEGTDPVLKKEYVLLTAHYDHVGVGKEGGGAYTEKDSIFNGARDNAMGTVALMAAARSISAQPTKRSVIVLAVTAEEVGLLGSQYYANYPLVPLENTIFNLNTDGAGYNDVTKISMLGFGRTGTDQQLSDAAAAAGLSIIADPAPEQGLFDRSDNVSFARMGVPALTLSPGFDSFDAEIQKYYHQVTDEADSIDFDYLYKYCRTFVEAARNIANMEGRPVWKEGDKYEQAGKDLYKR